MAVVNKQMTIHDVLEVDNNTARIFMEYGMHCLGCPHATGESVEQASLVHGVDADALIDAINVYLGAQDGKEEYKSL